MKITKIIVAGMLAAATFIGCAKDEGSPDTMEKSIKVKVQNSSATRSEIASPGSHNATIGKGYVFFTTDAGEILATPELADLTSPYQKSGLPASVSQIYVLSNVGETGKAIETVATATNISTIKAIATDINLQSDYTGTKDDITTPVTLWGSTMSLGSPTSVVDNVAQYDVTLSIAPVTSMLEIGKILLPADNDYLSSFRVDGVFINNFYKSSTVDGSLSDLLYSADKAEYVGPLVPGSAWASYPKFADVGAGGAGYTAAPDVANNNILTAKPTTGVWSYMVYPGKTAATLPHIIVKLSGLVSKDITPNPYDGKVYYVNVTEYVKGVDDPVTEFVGGKIYQIESIVFPPEKLDPDPEAPSANVTVTVNVVNWTTEAIRPK